MALRATPTIAICLTAGLAAGFALARPADAEPSAVPVTESVVETAPVNTSPYLADRTAESVEPTGATAPAEIVIKEFRFGGATTATAGASLAVTNLDAPAHTLTAVDGSFDTGTLNQNESAAFNAPAAPGTYEYFCSIHPSMVATITVT